MRRKHREKETWGAGSRALKRGGGGSQTVDGRKPRGGSCAPPPPRTKDQPTQMRAGAWMSPGRVSLRERPLPNPRPLAPWGEGIDQSIAID